MPKRIAIVGGGITGLAAAHDLERLTDAEIDLYEAEDRLGGKIATDQVGSLLIEAGPDCFFTRKPGAMEMVCELGLEEALIEPQRKEFSLLVDGTLHSVPGGLVTFTHSEPHAVQRATFLSDEAKAEVLAEGTQPAGSASDESIRSFFTRRFGGEFTRLVAEPLLAGTHGGDPGRLSIRALYPGYFELERRHGSLAAGMGPSGKGPARASFLSFRGGMQTLVNALDGALTRTRIHLNVRLSSSAELTADRTLLAIPANRTAGLLEPVAPEAASLMRRIPHRSSAIVTLAFPRAAVGHRLDGTGFLVPPSHMDRVSGATWSSQKWQGRAEAGTVLMRVFLAVDRGAASSETDERFVSDALAVIRPLLEIQGDPRFVRVTRWIDALPQYEVGHLDLLQRIGSVLPPDTSIAGTSFGGVGVPDCLRQGREAAKRMAETL